MDNILNWVFDVLKRNKIDVTPELKDELLVELRLVFKRIEWFIVDRVINNATSDFLSDYLPKDEQDQDNSN